jgi:hypothetical protein
VSGRTVAVRAAGGHAIKDATNTVRIGEYVFISYQVGYEEAELRAPFSPQNAKNLSIT